jgi:hypothetical protein
MRYKFKIKKKMRLLRRKGLQGEIKRGKRKKKVKYDKGDGH